MRAVGIESIDEANEIVWELCSGAGGADLTAALKELQNTVSRSAGR
jgi:hypothetical protein